MFLHTHISDQARRHARWFCAIAILLFCAPTIVLASGWPPSVTNDTATVSRGGTVSVLDSGNASVLANDFDLESDPLEAYLERKPKHGDVILNTDGTFVYTHDAKSRKRDDKFEYVAWDGSSYSSRRGKVEIRIDDSVTVAPIIIGQNPVSMSEDSALTVVLDFLLVTDTDNSYPDDFTLEVADGVNYSRVDENVTPTPNYVGPLTVPVRVNDGANYSQWFDLLVNVVSVNDPPFSIGTPPSQEAIENIQFTFESAPYFGDIDAEDSLRFSAVGLPDSGSLLLNEITGQLSGVPISADVSGTPYAVRVIATDQDGLSAAINFLLIVLSDDSVDLAVSVELSNNPVGVAENAEWNIDVHNHGPADLTEVAELKGDWTTSGAGLSLTAPPGCNVTGNGTSAPDLSCSLGEMPAGSVATITVQGVLDADGDNTVFARTISDDPVVENNVDVASGNVVTLFSEGASQIINVAAADIAAGDFDGDGNLDIAAAHAKTTVYYNSGNRDFTVPGINVGSGADHLVAVDWNGDGWIDIVASRQSDATVTILLNNAGVGFLPPVLVADSGVGTIQDMSVADFDQDGMGDIVVTGTAGSSILQNSADAPLVISIGSDPGISVAAGDLNQDSFPDVALVKTGDRRIAIYLNSGADAFASSSLDYGSAAYIDIFDVNNDGSNDLLLSTDGADLTAPRSIVAYQDGNGTFGPGESVGASIVASLVAGDLDGDNTADLVAIGNAGVHQTYRQNPATSFKLNEEQIISVAMRVGVIADFNNDQSLDLMLAGTGAGVMEFHANNGIGSMGLGDRIAPVLTMLGEAQMSIPAGAGFVDPGATADDDIEGDISSQIQISGVVNSAAPGNYRLTYSVADRAGNAVSATRTVVVEVNAGTGGSGGGSLSVTICLLLLLTLTIAGKRTRLSTESRRDRS